MSDIIKKHLQNVSSPTSREDAPQSTQPPRGYPPSAPTRSVQHRASWAGQWAALLLVGCGTFGQVPAHTAPSPCTVAPGRALAAAVYALDGGLVEGLRRLAKRDCNVDEIDDPIAMETCPPMDLGTVALRDWQLLATGAGALQTCEDKRAGGSFEEALSACDTAFALTRPYLGVLTTWDVDQALMEVHLCLTKR